jgi:NAD(P)-dependent dehydrogenase (short-subunit alcohol dehydrogenase family)
MAIDLEDKTVLVTGGSTGMGRASALAFGRKGAKVAIADLNVEGGKETVEMVKEAQGEATFMEVDVSKSVEVEALIDRVTKVYGGLDCAHNNAGIEGVQAFTADYAEEHWDQVIGVNLKGVWLCMKYEILKMLESGKGSIVNTSSTFGLVGSKMGLPAYIASKHGVVGLTRAAALEYAQKGIRVNAVCPGTIRTPMYERVNQVITGGNSEAKKELEKQIIEREPSGRIGHPEEVAEGVVWLCSDAASFVTGHTLVIDGGLTVQ